MTQRDIDAFVNSAERGALTPERVTKAVVQKKIPVNGRHSGDGSTALHRAVRKQRRELVVALLAAGADANMKDCNGWTCVWWCAFWGTADILQLLIDGGGSVNEPDNDGCTPLLVLVANNNGDAAARLGVMLARPELNLDAKYGGKTSGPG